MSVQERPFRLLTKVADDAPKLAIGLPVRRRSPVDFWMCLYQMLAPLNTKITYMIQKGAEKNVVGGKLPAEARNALLERALSQGTKYMFFLDDDVLFPDITLYRLWVSMQKHPEIGCLTAVGGTKLTPTEPLLYQEGVQGAWWDFHLGAITPIHSAWAGCMIVDMSYVAKLKEPWFNDVMYAEKGEVGERVKQNIWGQDRYFHKRIRDEAGGVVAADTGLLVAHYDADLQKAYILPPDSPCFQKQILGESFIPYFDDDAYVSWRRVVVPDQPDIEFKGYLDWLNSQAPPPEPEIISILPDVKKPEVVEHEGFTVTDSRKGDFSEWMKEVGA